MSKHLAQNVIYTGNIETDVGQILGCGDVKALRRLKSSASLLFVQQFALDGTKVSIKWRESTGDVTLLGPF